MNGHRLRTTILLVALSFIVAACYGRPTGGELETRLQGQFQFLMHETVTHGDQPKVQHLYSHAYTSYVHKQPPYVQRLAQQKLHLWDRIRWTDQMRLLDEVYLDLRNRSRNGQTYSYELLDFWIDHYAGNDVITVAYGTVTERHHGTVVNKVSLQTATKWRREDRHWKIVSHF